MVLRVSLPDSEKGVWGSSSSSCWQLHIHHLIPVQPTFFPISDAGAESVSAPPCPAHAGDIILKLTFYCFIIYYHYYVI